MIEPPGGSKNEVGCLIGMIGGGRTMRSIGETQTFAKTRLRHKFLAGTCFYASKASGFHGIFSCSVSWYREVLLLAYGRYQVIYLSAYDFIFCPQ